MKILVLDDHAGFRHEVVSMLKNNGHAVEDVETPEAAIPLVECGKYDFVLVDYSMPEHDGLWFMQHVKKPEHTKVLLMTAQNNLHIIFAIIRAGGDGYIIKPFDEANLLSHLNFYSQNTSREIHASAAHHGTAARRPASAYAESGCRTGGR
jgi:two-component system chemotaxis response regulator CheY